MTDSKKFDSFQITRKIRVAACLYVLNAEHDIQEWIAYHRTIGIQSFLIYDNGCTDRTVSQALALSSAADIRIISWDHVTGIGSQCEAYRNCAHHFKDEFDWILFIDVDEFLISSDAQQIDMLLAQHTSHAGIAFNWACFGSNGHIEPPTGLTIEAFTTRAKDTFNPNWHTKLIVQPKKMLGCAQPHYFDVDGSIVRPNGNKVEWEKPGLTRTIDLSEWYINHYFVKSRAQWDVKLKRGYRDTTERDGSLFSIYDRNEVVDQTAAMRAAEVRSLLRRTLCRHTIDALPDITTDPIVRKDGFLCLHIDGTITPLRLGYEPVTTFLPGWQPRFVYAGFAPFLILTFVNDFGTTACWIVSGDGTRLGGSLDELDPTSRRALYVRIVPVIQKFAAITTQQPMLPINAHICAADVAQIYVVSTLLASQC